MTITRKAEYETELTILELLNQVCFPFPDPSWETSEEEKGCLLVSPVSLADDAKKLLEFIKAQLKKSGIDFPDDSIYTDPSSQYEGLYRVIVSSKIFISLQGKDKLNTFINFIGEIQKSAEAHKKEFKDMKQKMSSQFFDSADKLFHAGQLKISERCTQLISRLKASVNPKDIPQI